MLRSASPRRRTYTESALATVVLRLREAGVRLLHPYPAPLELLVRTAAVDAFADGRRQRLPRRARSRRVHAGAADRTSKCYETLAADSARPRGRELHGSRPSGTPRTNT